MHRKAIQVMEHFVAGMNVSGARKIGVLFSGGRDSSILAAALCHIVDVELHLISMTTGVGHGFENIEAQAERIRLMGMMHGVVVHRKNISIKDQFQELVMRELEADFVQRGFKTMLACVGCKYLMHLAALKYAKSTGLHALVDGYSVRQQEFPEQTYSFIKYVELLSAIEGITCCSPLYHLLDTRENIIQMLHGFGLEKSEGTCMFAFAFSPASPHDITGYLDALKQRIK